MDNEPDLATMGSRTLTANEDRSSYLLTRFLLPLAPLDEGSVEMGTEELVTFLVGLGCSSSSSDFASSGINSSLNSL
jgi:hypothetical protein